MQLSVDREHSSRRWLIAAIFFVISICLVFLLISFNQEVSSQQPQSVEFISDEAGGLTLDEVRIQPNEVWKGADATVSLGMARHPYWLKIVMPTSEKLDDPYLLEIQYPLLDQVDIWFFDQADSQTPVANYSVGDAEPFSQRPIENQTFVIPLPESADGKITAYMRVQTQGSIKVPLQVWSQQAFVEYNAKTHITIGLFFGVLCAMALSNFFFFLTTWNKTFLVYTAHVVALTLTLVAIQGFGFEFLWPNNTWLQERAIALFANASIMFAMFFTDLLLELKTHSLRVSRFVRGLGWVFFANVLISLFLPYFYLIQIFLVLLLFVVGVVFAVGIWLSLKNIVIARYYTLAWLVLLCSAFAAALDNLNFVEIPITNSTLMLYGAVAETLLLAFVLAMSYGNQRNELETAKDRVVDNEKEMALTKDKLLTLEQQAKDELEYKVQERTLELEITLRELSDANRELERLNTIDPLTGIRNRRFFDKRIIAEGRRARRERTPLCLVMLDIDHFKRINDQYGHDVGDRCIEHVAQLAKTCLKRPSDDVCRYGGEEFAFILPNTEIEGAYSLIDSVRSKIESTPCVSDEQSINMTVSAGIASRVINTEGDEREVLKHADKALYQAKSEGRNRVIKALED